MVAGPGAGRPSGLPHLDDSDHAYLTIGQASSLLGMAVGALRRLEASTGEELERSAGGQRRFSRNQLKRLGRISDVMDEGITAHGARRIIDLEDRIVDLEAQLAQAKGLVHAWEKRT